MPRLRRSFRAADADRSHARLSVLRQRRSAEAPVRVCSRTHRRQGDANQCTRSVRDVRRSARLLLGPVTLNFVRALRHRNYKLFFTGQLISLVGTWMQSVAESWLVFRLTGSSALLGLSSFASQIPVFLFATI